MRFFNRGALIGAVIGVVVSALLLLTRDFFGLENLVFDAFTRAQVGRLEADPRILLVTVSDESVEALGQMGFGRWPYDRELMARVIEEAKIGGARLVLFDVSFPAPNTESLEGDARFAAAMKSMPVILGVQSKPAATFSATPPPFNVMLWRGDSSQPRPARLVLPHAEFVPSSGIGSMRLGSARDYVLADQVGENHFVPSLALAAAREIRRLKPHITTRPGELRVGALSLPTTDEGLMRLRWRAAKDRRGTLLHHNVDFHQVVEWSALREFPDHNPEEAKKLVTVVPERFKDKIVFVAVTAQGLFDLRVTPLSNTTAGVEIHATALDNLLNGDPQRLIPIAFVLFPLILLTTLLGRFLEVTFTQLTALFAAAAAAGGWVAIAYLMQGARWVIPTVGPTMALLLTYMIVTVVEYIAEQKRGARLKLTFGRYVSPQILTHVLANPEMVELGGERREMTILFSDIRGFTTISEATEPENVVEMLNEYLTEMVEILLRYGGTLDKFIGDAVMGFWNAPTDDPDHALHAVECSIDMIAKTAELRERWEQEGKPAIRIGIGVNSGEAVVGNIGSRQVFGYTVIGDAVNLASRLESKNKDYGTEIIISEMTLSRIPPDKYELAYLDDVKVKGKEKAVKIYEVKGRRT